MFHFVMIMHVKNLRVKTMIYKGDYVKIVKIGNPYFGETGVVKEIRTAIDDTWALISGNGFEDYYRTGEVVVEQRHIPVVGALENEYTI